MQRHEYEAALESQRWLEPKCVTKGYVECIKKEKNKTRHNLTPEQASSSFCEHPDTVLSHCCYPLTKQQPV